MGADTETANSIMAKIGVMPASRGDNGQRVEGAGFATRLDAFAYADSNILAEPDAVIERRLLRNFDPIYEMIDSLRIQFGNFVNLNLGDSSGYGFNTNSKDAPDIAPLVRKVLGAVNNFGEIFSMLDASGPLELSYRAVLINTNAELKGFLLELKHLDLKGGVNQSDLAGVLSACIGMEKIMAARMQDIDLMKQAISQETQSQH